MANIITEIKNRGQYWTKSAAESLQADALHKDGLVLIESGNSVIQNGVSITIKHCTPTDKFKVLSKKGLI